MAASENPEELIPEESVPEEEREESVTEPEDESAPTVEAANEPIEETDAAEEVMEETEDGRGWYVIHCYSGYENKVRHNLEQRIESMGMKEKIFDVVIPTQEEIEVRDGKRRSIERHVFPGYVLVNMIMTEESWYVVRNTPGVTGFCRYGQRPNSAAAGRSLSNFSAGWKLKHRPLRLHISLVKPYELLMARSTTSMER